MLLSIKCSLNGKNLFQDIVPVIQNVSIRQETNFNDTNTCLGIKLTKQVQLVISTGFPGSSKSKVIFGPIF
jgi:hypothetical protein